MVLMWRLITRLSWDRIAIWVFNFSFLCLFYWGFRECLLGSWCIGTLISLCCEVVCKLAFRLSRLLSLHPSHQLCWFLRCYGLIWLKCICFATVWQLYCGMLLYNLFSNLVNSNSYRLQKSGLEFCKSLASCALETLRSGQYVGSSVHKTKRRS